MKLYNLQTEMKVIKSLFDSPTKVKEKLYSKTDLSLFGYGVSQEIFKRIDTLKKAGKKIGSSDTFKNDSSLSDEAITCLEGEEIKPVKNFTDARFLINELKTYKKYRAVDTGLSNTLKTLKNKNIDLNKVTKELENIIGTLKDGEAVKEKPFIFKDDCEFPAPLNNDAYYGIFGDFVRKIVPHTEADPVGVLISIMVAFGNVLGRGPNFPISASWHYTNLFALTVGESGVARKGLAKDIAVALTKSIDKDWALKLNISGLSSGEGLVENVLKGGDFGNDVEIPSCNGDDEPIDRRMMIWESEFASVLTKASKESSILSMILRSGFDGENLNVRTRGNPLIATNPHLSIVGHITPDELSSKIKSVDITNGFANRFLFMMVKGGEDHSDGGLIIDEDYCRLHSKILKKILEFWQLKKQNMKDPKEMIIRFSDKAQKIWDKKYKQWKRTKYRGVVGSLFGRAAPIVRRLATIYAVSNCSNQITTDHLKAALALWKYHVDSVKILFKDMTGDYYTDNLLSALQQAYPDYISRTQINNEVFSRNANKGKIDSSLKSLFRRKEAEGVEVKKGRGRPELKIRWVPPKQKKVKTRNPLNSPKNKAKYDVVKLDKKITNKIIKLNQKIVKLKPKKPDYYKDMDDLDIVGI